jgi:transcriptional regulator with XRE-family HTH domain
MAHLEKAVSPVAVKQAAEARPLDVSLVIRHRLKELGLEQRDLAAAAQVTESYISQLLARKKAPPTSGRTDIYHRIEIFLKLPEGGLSKLADLQRREELKKKVADPPPPLFPAFRELILRKCDPARELPLRESFGKEPFGALERLVTQKLLDAAKRVAGEKLDSEQWLQRVAGLSGLGHAQARAIVLEFLDADIFRVSGGNCIALLDSLVHSWDIDLETFSIEIVLNRHLAPGRLKRFDFVEREPENPVDVEPGLEEFLRDPLLSGDATDEEIEFLKRLRFKDRRPLPLYYYRVLQNTRDPLHFRAGPGERV